MVGAEYPHPVCEQLGKGIDRLGRAPDTTAPVREISANSEGVGVVWSEYPGHVSEEYLQRADSARYVAGLTTQAREVPPGGERGGVISA